MYQATPLIKTDPLIKKDTFFEKLTAILIRILVLIFGFMAFFPQVNPGRIMEKINVNTSLFTTALSYETLTGNFGLIMRRGWLTSGNIYFLMACAAVILLGIALCAVGACMSLGNRRMQRLACAFPLSGSALTLLSAFGISYLFKTLSESKNAKALELIFPNALYIFIAFSAVILILSIIRLIQLRGPVEAQMEMEEKYRLFLMLLPVLLLAFVFSYLPIYGWRYAFFDYDVGDKLSRENFVAFKWFTFLFEGSAYRRDILRVLKNTLIMSGLGIATSWLPVAFAILLAEIRSSRFQRFVQTFTTIPNFISWVLVYSFALAIFSTDGFINSFLRNVLHISGANTDYLASADFTWIKMLFWGTWKGLGWSEIIYIAGISGIDQQLYEAARVDGANRFHCMWHITVPGLMGTYCVMLLMSIAGILSNGMEQYLVFSNPINKDVIEVLDLYVYNLGIKQGLVPISTVVGIFKSLVGITLLFSANGISKLVRGESII